MSSQKSKPLPVFPSMAEAKPSCARADCAVGRALRPVRSGESAASGDAVGVASGEASGRLRTAGTEQAHRTGSLATSLRSRPAHHAPAGHPQITSDRPDGSRPTRNQGKVLKAA